MNDKLVDMFGDTLIPEEEQLNNLVYWYPILSDIRMRVPDTIIVHRGAVRLSEILDGKEPPGYKRFETEILAAMDDMGYPCFFRTGMTSDKFQWEDTCYVKERPTSKDLMGRIGRLVETSYMANIAGRPINYDFWCVRKFIETNPVVTHFNNMPIAMEVRAFLREGKIQCIHPYWVPESFERASDEVKEKAKALAVVPSPEEDRELYEMLLYIADNFKTMGNVWAVDMLKDKNGGWWATDMALGKRAYHFPQCEFCEKH